MELVIRKPLECDKDTIERFVESFDGEKFGLHGDYHYRRFDCFEDWLESVKSLETDGMSNWYEVPASEWLCFDSVSGELVAMMNVRHRLNFVMYVTAGHLSLSVKSEFRRVGVASQLIDWTIEFLRDLGEDELMVVCVDGNNASKRLIESKGGIECGRYNLNFEPVLRYKIPLNRLNNNG